MELKHTLFSAPFVVDTVNAELEDGKAPNFDWRKRKGDIDSSIQYDRENGPNLLDLPLYETIDDIMCYTNDEIRAHGTKLGIKWKRRLNKPGMISAIRKYIEEAKGITDHDEFTKFYPTFRGTTGGIMTVMCTHGVVYYAKSLIGGEGASDAADAMLTVKAKVFVYDAMGQVVNHMAKRSPSFFGYSRGLPAPNTARNRERIQQYLRNNTSKLAIELPTLVSLQELKSRTHHTGLIDPLHIDNSKVLEDRLLRRVELVKGWPIDQNHIVHEQIWSRTLKMVTSITQMGYANFVSTFNRNILFNNQLRARALRKKHNISHISDISDEVITQV